MAYFNYSNYLPISDISWSGRIDGFDRMAMRWHQIVELVDLDKVKSFKDSIVLLGFCCDEGVRRNLGRIGAKEAPSSFRRVLGNLPVFFSASTSLKDAGDIWCDDGDLEQAQFVLSEAVARVLSGGGFPLVLGGGHEVMYGHYQGLRKVYKSGKIGVINLDAHLDIRAVTDGRGNSGTGFYQIGEDCDDEKNEFHYLAIGVQEISNTKSLFDYAHEKSVHIIYANEIHLDNKKRICDIIEAFSKEVDHVYLTIDMDFFAAPYAPGVSALAFNGVIPDDTFFAIFSMLLSLSNLRSVDIAELNPIYDIDDRTVRLASSLLFQLVSKF